MQQPEALRKFNILKQVIAKFELNLSELVVFTEAGSGNYAFTPIIAALAGAQRVFAITANSKYGTVGEIFNNVNRLASFLGLENRIEMVAEKREAYLREADIVTNSGFVRPINKKMIDSMKNTAVIPLMWETWEYREEELDLAACRKKGIVVLGTDEHHPWLNLFVSNGFLICKLLFEKGFGVYKDNVLLISSGHIGDSAAGFFIKNNLSFRRVVFDNKIPERQKRFVLTQKEVLDSLDAYDAIVIAEHHHNVDILSQEGFIPTALLKEKNPVVQIIHVCGSVNKNDIVQNGLSIYPEEPAPFGYMTVSPDYLGPKTILELNTAGLKVGEVMARCRLRGLTVKETVEYALSNIPAMDFKDGGHC